MTHTYRPPENLLDRDFTHKKSHTVIGFIILTLLATTITLSVYFGAEFIGTLIK